MWKILCYKMFETFQNKKFEIKTYEITIYSYKTRRWGQVGGGYKVLPWKYLISYVLYFYYYYYYYYYYY